MKNIDELLLAWQEQEQLSKEELDSLKEGLDFFENEGFREWLDGLLVSCLVGFQFHTTEHGLGWSHSTVVVESCLSINNNVLLRSDWTAYN